MLVLFIHLHVQLHAAALVAAQRAGDALDRRRSETGQTSAEYALVLLGAASVAILVALWAKKSGRVGELLDAVFDGVVDMVR